MPPSPRFFFEGPRPAPSPVEAIGGALSDMVPPHLRQDPEAISGIFATRGPEVMKNFIANVGQNRTMPAATESLHRGFNDIAAERIAEIANANPEFINNLFKTGYDEIPEMTDLLRTTGQLNPGNNPLKQLVRALLEDDVSQIHSLSGLVRQRLHVLDTGEGGRLPGSPEMDIAEAMTMAPSGGQVRGNSLSQLMSAIDAIDMNSTFRIAEPGISAGRARSSADRYNRDLVAEDAENNDQLITVYELLEDAGVPPQQIYESLLRKMFKELDQDIDFGGEPSAAPFLSGERIAADITQGANPMSGTGLPETLNPALFTDQQLPEPYQPDPDFFLRMMGVRR